MSQRNPTSWDSNTDKLDGVAYSSASVTYSSATTAYSSSTTALADNGKLPATWTSQSKVASSWQSNPSASANEYVYDSAVDTYDSAVQSYDGVVVGQDFLNTNEPSVWSDLVAS